MKGTKMEKSSTSMKAHQNKLTCDDVAMIFFKYPHGCTVSSLSKQSSKNSVWRITASTVYSYKQAILQLMYCIAVNKKRI